MMTREAVQPFLTVRGILEHVLSLHHRGLQQYAEAVQRCSADPRRAAVLDFLRGSEREFVAAIARFGQSEDPVLDSFVQSVPAALLTIAIEIDEFDGVLDTVLDEYARRDAALVGVYGQLESSMAAPRVKRIFRDLGDLCLHNQRRLRQALLDF